MQSWITNLKGQDLQNIHIYVMPTCLAMFYAYYEYYERI